MIIDIYEAKMKHLQWRFKLSMFLLGRQMLTMEQMVSHKHCDLGKWIYSEGLNRFGHLPVMNGLEENHRLLHEAIARTVDLQLNGNEVGANAAYEEMKLISDLIMDDLDKMEDLLQKSGLY